MHLVIFNFVRETKETSGIALFFLFKSSRNGGKTIKRKGQSRNLNCLYFTFSYLCNFRIGNFDVFTPSNTESWAIVGKLWKPLGNGR